MADKPVNAPREVSLQQLDHPTLSFDPETKEPSHVQLYSQSTSAERHSFVEINVSPARQTHKVVLSDREVARDIKLDPQQVVELETVARAFAEAKLSGNQNNAKAMAARLVEVAQKDLSTAIVIRH